MIFIQQHQPVHLAGQTNPLDLISCNVRALQHPSYGQLRSRPPVLGILLGPLRLRRADGLMIRGLAANNFSLFIDQYSPSARRSNVNAKIVGHGFFTLSRRFSRYQQSAAQRLSGRTTTCRIVAIQETSLAAIAISLMTVASFPRTAAC